MHRVSRLPLLLLTLTSLVGARAETDDERRAREDLERQLKSMVATPPTKIRVEFVGLDQPNYQLLEASFELDGTRLPVGDLKTLNSDGNHLIFHGDVKPGEHRLETHLHYQNTTSQVVSEEGGYKWKPGSTVTFKTEQGIEVQVKVTPELDLKADIKKRLKVSSPATVKMLAKLDDGSMPEPMERPKIVMPVEPVDAGVEVVKGETAAEKAAKLAEAKKKEREDAAAAKKAAADEKKRLADEARAAKLADATARKQAAADAAAAKKQAAADAAAAKKQAAADAAQAKKDAASGKTVVAAEKTGEPVVAVVDAGAVAEAAPTPEVIDAGPPVVAVAPPPPPKKVEPAPAPVEASGLPLPLPVLIGLGLAVLGLILFFVARSRKKS